MIWRILLFPVILVLLGLAALGGWCDDVYWRLYAWVESKDKPASPAKEQGK